MKDFKEMLVESVKADAADVNEILTALYIAKGDWNMFGENAGAVRSFYDKKVAKLPEKVLETQDGRAQKMAELSLRWAKENGFESPVSRVWWIDSRIRDEEEMAIQIDNRTNPSDILIKFTDDTYLGVSAKSTGRLDDVGFKNPGLGTIERELGLSLNRYWQEGIDRLASDFGMEPNRPTIRRRIKTNKRIQIASTKIGDEVISTIRDAIYARMSRMNEKRLFAHLMKVWLNAERSTPPYIKVTGRGKDGEYSAKLENPGESVKVHLLAKGPIAMEKNGVGSITFRVYGKRIFSIRVKYKQEKVTSNIKLSGE